MNLFKVYYLRAIIMSGLLSLTSLHASSPAKITNILVFFSHSSSTPSYNMMLENLRNKLNDEIKSYNLHVEYLEAERYPAGEYPGGRFDVFNNKYRELDLDLLICIGNNIMDPIKKNADDYLLKLKAVIADYDYSEYGHKTDLNLNNNTYQIPIKYNIIKTLDEAIALFPKTRSIYFIAGASQFDSLLINISKSVAEKYLIGKQINYVNNLSMPELQHFVKSLPEHSIIFIPTFTMDSRQVPYYTPEAIRLISMNANSPVFSYSNIGIGDGALGGYVHNYNKAGILIGEIAANILNRIKPGNKIKEDDYYSYLFDWRVLEKWGLNDSGNIPSESIILYYEPDIFEEYKWLIAGIILFVMFQTFLIVNLIRLNRDQRVMTKKVIETEEKYRKFLHEDRSLRIGHLTASLSHELNQPLTAILSTAQAGINFINSKESTPDLLKQILQKIIDNNKRTSLILNSIRGMMKFESRDKEKINLNRVIYEVAAVYENELKNHNALLNLKFPEHTVWVLADGVQIQQVLLNLIQNALQSFGRNGSESVKKIEISQLVIDNEVTVSVRDYGRGIDNSVKEKLFQPFNSSKKEGTGIGLTICRSIIEDHEGRIWAESVPEGGARFSFSLKVYNEQS